MEVILCFSIVVFMTSPLIEFKVNTHNVYTYGSK